jgi:Na+/melibiose symporter-like transporter
MASVIANANAVSVNPRTLTLASASRTAMTAGGLLAYGGLAFPLCLAGIPILIYLPAFYAKELHLSAGLVGVVFLLARLWDGLSDLVVGSLSDRTQSRWGRRKPWAVLGAPFLMASTWFLCNPPAGVGMGYLCSWTALFYTSWTAIYIPYLSWGTELATDYDERSRVTSFRECFTMLGVLFFATAPLILAPAHGSLRGVLLLISLAVLCAVPFAVVPLALRVPDPMPPQLLRPALIRELAALIRDPVLLRFEVGRLFWSMEEGVTSSLLVFSFGVGLHLPDMFFWALFVLYVATLCTLPMALQLAKRIEKHVMLAGGVAIQALMYGLAMFVPMGNFTLVAILWAVSGVATTTMLTLPGSIIADIVDHGEMLTGKRHSGAYVAVDNLIYKLGMALGVGMAFGLMELVHFQPDAVRHSALDVRNIRLLGFGLPCLLSLPAIVLYLMHPITRQAQRRLREQLESRAASAEP